MKKLLLAVSLITLISCTKKTNDKPYTVTFTAYSKNVPYQVQYKDQDMNWFTDSVRTNNFTKSIQGTTKGFSYTFTVTNGKRIANDSIYAKINIGSNEKHESLKFSNVSANVSLQLTAE